MQKRNELARREIGSAKQSRLRSADHRSTSNPRHGFDVPISASHSCEQQRTRNTPLCSVAKTICTHLKSGRVGTNHLLHDLTLVEEDKGGHGVDTDLLSNLLLGIDIDLVEADLLTGWGVRDLLEDRANNLAGSTPGGPEVDHDRLVAVDLLNRWEQEVGTASERASQIIRSSGRRERSRSVTV